jgi:hypothetical protein
MLLPKIPFAAVTFCPDLDSHTDDGFDYNAIVNALRDNAISIENVTSREFVNYSFNIA